VKWGRSNRQTPSTHGLGCRDVTATRQTCLWADIPQLTTKERNVADMKNPGTSQAVKCWHTMGRRTFSWSPPALTSNPVHINKHHSVIIKALMLPITALTLFVGRQEEHPACKNSVMRCLLGYRSEVRCKWFAYGPADATSSLASLNYKMV